MTALVFVAAASPAAAASITLDPAAPGPVGEGVPYHLSITVKSTAYEEVPLTLALRRRGSSAPLIPFFAQLLVSPEQTTVLSAVVTPAQWFRSPGRFEVVPEIGERPAGQVLPITVLAPPVQAPLFRDVTRSAGLGGASIPGPDCGHWSNGLAWGDVNGDGYPDLYVTRQNLPAKLFINDGHGHFTDEASHYRVAHPGLATGAVFADYDNDGKLDLYVTGDGGNHLYDNDGHGHFADVTAHAGLADGGPATSASWADFNNDGHLDLMVTDHLRCTTNKNDPRQGVYYPSHLYRNNGNGTFTDVTSLLDQVDPSSTMGAGFEPVWFDAFGTGRQDLYLGNDFYGGHPQPNHLFRNDGGAPDGSWRFTDISRESGTRLSIHTMGIGLGDPDRDGRLDLALSNIESNVLLHNNGDGTFTNTAESAGIARPTQQVGLKSLTWGPLFGDYNLDGWEDLYISAGHLAGYVGGANGPQSNELFVNRGNGTFLDLSAPSHADDSGQSRGDATADYLRNGRLDIAVADQNGTVHLFKNITPYGGNHWLEVKTVGTRSNVDGCGAFLKLSLGGRPMVREVLCGSQGEGSGSDEVVHFGLGKLARVPQLTIRWPSGTKQVLRNVGADKLIRVVEP